MQLEPIGTVVSPYTNPKELVFACEKGLRTKTQMRIVVDERYAQGLKGVEECSHFFVMYVLDQASRVELTTHPGPPSVELPQVGIFASRSQYRPNHIALRLVRLLRREGNELVVEGLDAINGSKVIDIKPYVQGFDRPDQFRTAPWYEWLK